MKKYKLRLDLKRELGLVTLFRIERLSNGELGGYIESEKNLSQVGHAWVSGNAWVFGNAFVFDNALVSGHAWVSGHALVSGDAQVSGNARVSGNAQVSGSAFVFGNALISGNAWVSGDAQVSGNARVFGDAQVSGNARIENIKEILNIIIAFKFSITITPDNIVIGDHLKKRSEWLKVTKEEAEELGLTGELYENYRSAIKWGMKMVPKRKRIQK
jgi:carbonic anhydrase/acetyltransferase-like protein (isoleucine patch superfamily)